MKSSEFVSTVTDTRRSSNLMFRLKNVILNTCLSVVCLFFGSWLYAEPFDSCPSEAFLGQSTIAQLYGVQLATGYYSLLSNDMDTTGKINAMGFNFHDNYLYAWSYQHGTVVRIGSDYQITPLAITGLPSVNFYIGDVAVADNVYYFYKPGSSYGLYSVSLDSTSADYLQANKVVSGSALDLKIYDMAFHPTDEHAYSVNASGQLYRFNVLTGGSEILGDTGETGTFGAVYFDVDKNLYISRNSDGYIFRIKVGQANYTAEFFAFGPSSSNNDGARCALAPVILADNPTVDFGDAPTHYGTTATNNGARHDITDGILYLGLFVDGESDANGLGNDRDDDGVQFATGLAVGEPALIEIIASAAGYINAWIDFDADGEFDDDEKIASGLAVNEGSNTFQYFVPEWAEATDSWSRFRLSSEENIGATGGVSDGEVEDYPLTIVDANTSLMYYPAKNQWATLAFEDNWPLVGDYDFTDLVVNYRITEYRTAGSVSSSSGSEISRIKIEGQIAAVGAAFHNGFAFHLSGILRSQINESEIRYKINNKLQIDSPLEVGRNAAIIIVANDVWDFVSAGENCKYYRTEAGCGSAIQMVFSLTIPFHNDLRPPTMPELPYDPFIYATEGYQRNYVFGQPPGRAYEVHMKGHAPTEAARSDFFTRGDDASNPSLGDYYITEAGMPWVINVGTEWRYPLEYMDVIYAYPEFPDFIISSGQSSVDWFTTSRAVLKNTFSQ